MPLIPNTLTLGERIRKRRRELNMTQESLGDKLEVHANTIRKWEKELSYPNAEEFNRLAEVLNTTTDYLYGKTEKNTNNSFVKNSAYQDTTEINDSIPSMAYWGSLVDNAEKAAEYGKNLDVILTLINSAYKTIYSAIQLTEGKNSSLSIIN